MNVTEFKEKFPMYKNWSDENLAKELHQKFYKEMGYKEFADQFLVKDKPKGEGITSQFERIGDVYKEEVAQGQSKMSEFTEQPRGKTFFSGALGLIQYLSAPVKAISKGAVEEPITEGLTSVGVPETASKVVGETAGGLVDIGLTGGVPYGKVVKSAIERVPQEILKREAETIGPKIVKDIGTNLDRAKPPLKFPSEPSEALGLEMAAEGKLSKPIVQEGIQKTVADAALKNISPDERKKRVGQQIIDAIYKEEWDWGSLPNVLKKYDITPEEFAQRLKDTYSASGRTLQRLSVVSKKMNQIMKDNPEAAKVFEELGKTLPEGTFFDKFMAKFYQVESTRRAFLVTQLATSVRNAISQSARVSLGSIDEAFQGAIKATVGGEGDFVKQVGNGLDMWSAAYNRLSPAGRKQLDNILNAEGNEIIKNRLLGSPVHEVAMGSKVANILNTPNRLQEFFFRKMAFEAKLTQLLEKSGQSIKNIDPSKIPQGMLEEAVQYGLEMTFSAMPKSEMAKKFVQDWAKNPVMTALANPFPRFAFGNALPFMVNFSPIGFMKAMNPKVVAELASGNPEMFAQSASKAILGTSMLGMANWIRNSEYGGEKWYEVNVNGKTIDTRSFAPFNTFLLISEAANHPERLKAQDWIQAAIGLNRVAGTGLVVTDLFRGKKLENAVDIVKRFIGEYAGSFTVPARTAKDIYAQFNPEEGYRRDVRESPMIGPSQKNIPVVSQSLPEARTPARVGPITDEYPAVRQFSGLSLRVKEPLEKEVDKLGIDVERIYPRTGVPEADRKLSEIMAPAVTKVVPQIINNPEYQKLGNPIKKLIWAELMSRFKKQARNELMAKDPKLYMQIRWEGFRDDVKDILEERGITREQLRKK